MRSFTAESGSVDWDSDEFQFIRIPWHAKPVNFNVEYTSGSGKKYVEKYTVNLTAGSMLKADYRPDDENKALLSIPVLMQEMLKQNL